MASRFWAGGSSSEEESEYSDVSDEETSNQQQRNGPRWVIQSDSDSDEETRVVKSVKEKALEAINNSCSVIRSSMKTDDWIKILSEFDALAKHLDKGKNVIISQGYPRSYIQTMVQLEDLMAEKVKNKSEQKKLSKENSKALIRMKGKLKKSVELIKNELQQYREHPPVSDEEKDESSGEDESEEEDESEDESEGEVSDVQSSEEEDLEVAKASSVEDDEGSDADDESEVGDSDDESWPSSSESSSSEDEDVGQLKGRAKWLKKTPATTSAKVQKAKVPKAARDKVRRASLDEPKKQIDEELNLTTSQFDARMKEAVAMRGKKGTEIAEQIALLRTLANYSRRLGPSRQIVASMCLLGAQLFDAFNKIDSFMSARAWRSAYTHLSDTLLILEQNPGFELAPLSMEDQADILKAGRGDIGAKEEDVNEYVDPYPKANECGKIKVSGDLVAFIERLSEEYTKSLQQTDPHTSDYICRLFDENLLTRLAARVQEYYNRKADPARAAVMALVRAEYLCYKHDSIAKALHLSQLKREKYGDPIHIHPGCNGSNVAPNSVDSYDPETRHPASLSGPLSVSTEMIDTEMKLRELCLYVFKHGDIRAKTRAMLCRIYHHALHDRFHEARDLLLMSYIQDNINNADIPTQIFFNRMMAQVGLCAFRLGLVKEAHACLTEICTGTRTKELLAQGMQSYRYQERDPEQERLERRRQVPFHMHINLDLLETCHLISAMLLDVPSIVNPRLSDRKRPVSKAFRKLLAFHERLVFQGPPENPREHVVAAAKLLAQGSWKKCAELLVGLSVWDLFPGAGVPVKVREKVQHKIQVEALRVYLLAFSEEYETVSLARLMEMFELDGKMVHSIVSQMMISEEIQGAWDQSSQSIVFERDERSNLHMFALQFSDKLATLVENNERLMELRTVGTVTGKDDWKTGRGESNWSRSVGDRGQRTSQQNGRNWKQGSRNQHRGAGTNVGRRGQQRTRNAHSER